MDSTGPSKELSHNQGIVLFMVMGAVALLSIVVTEMSYLSTVSKRIAYDALDQVKTYYLMESGLKISLLRLKAYQGAKKILAAQTQQNPAIASMVPKNILEQIWAFPLRFPIPEKAATTLGDQESIRQFNSSSGFSTEMSFTTTILSESSRINLNALLPSFAAKPTAAQNPGSPAPANNQNASPPTPNPPTPPFDPEAARKSLYDYLYQVLQQKFADDVEFAGVYRDFRLDEWIDALAGWVDRTYEPRVRVAVTDPPLKRAPMYSVSELQMLPQALQFDDELFRLFEPHLTTSPAQGINCNTVELPVLRGLFPMMTPEELKKFFEYRDDATAANFFPDTARFFSWIQGNVSAFRNDPQEVARYRTEMEKRGQFFVTEESVFRVMVSAEVNQAQKTLQAQIFLTEPKAPAPPGGQPIPGIPMNGTDVKPDTGIRVLFVRIL